MCGFQRGTRCVPPACVGVLHHVIRAQRHDGFNAASHAFLRLDVDRKADPVSDVLRDNTAAHLKGSSAH